MSLVPKVTCEDIRLALNGIFSGSAEDVSGQNSYYFWDQRVTSGSVLAQINLANYYLIGVLGEAKINETTPVAYYHVRTALLDLSCMRVITLLSGDVIVDGFNVTLGPTTIQQPSLLSTYRMLIEQFKEQVRLHIRAIQPIAVSAESDEPIYRETAQSYY
jgi:hypothetical protein